MKRLSLLLVMIITVCLSFGTIDEFYDFNATTGTYTPITGTVVSEILSDDAISAAIPLGFDFPFGENSYSEIKISSNGWIGLGTTQTSSNLSNNLASTTIVPVIAPLWDDLSMAAGSVEYLLTGASPNQIFTVQYSNVKWNYSGTNQYNFQVRIYQTGKIDFIYGPATGTPNNPSASIGINMLPGGAGNYFSITPGTPATVSTTASNNAIVAIPDNGTLYEFNPVVAVPNDLMAVSITGNTTPTAGMVANYTITVRNRGSVAQSTYLVKLFRGNNIEIGSMPGTAIQPGANLTFSIPWTPAAAGPDVLYGRVILTGDQNPANDQTPNLNVTVQPTGVQSVTIGDGSEQARVPMDFYWGNSLFETLYYPDELGFASGTITAVQFYNNFLTNLPTGATKIWLGSTNTADLSAGWIPAGELTLVFDGNVDYLAGPNTITIPLQTPYMHTPGNLVMMVNRPMDPNGYYDFADNFEAQTVGTNRARKVQSDGTQFDPYNPPTTSTLSGQFPKTTLIYSGQAIVNDLGALTITGNATPSVGSATNYTVRVKNNGTAVQTNYQVKLFKEGDVEVGSVNGTAINSLQILEYNIPWTPAVTGPTYLYGRVVLANDEIAQNNQTANLNVNVQQAGIVAVTVGAGGSTGRMPVDMYYMNSLFETVYLGSELNIGGLLTAIQFYNNFVTNLPGMPTNIWVGETTQTDLSAGWIPSTQLTQVFAGNVDYPSGANNILINLTTPYAYGGGNLVVMVQRPMDTQYYSPSDYFVTQTGTVAARTLNAYADGTAFDPANPPAGTAAQPMFPMTTFMLITEGMGSISGTVRVGTTPLAGATVTVGGTPLSFTTGADGTYSFPYVIEGARQVSATKHGYNVVTHTVNVVEDQNVVQDFTIALLPQVTITGRIVGSDQPTVGLAGATITLSGYEPYTATTNAQGNFTITGVFSSQTYNYVAIAAGYQQATGQVVVGTGNVNMGDVIVNEIAFPAYNVVATEAANYSNVVVTWSEPGTAETGWIHYDSGENDDSIGTGGTADFDVAIRFPASALTMYAGASLQALKVWPAQPGAFSLRVWTGGTPTAPGNMVVDQAFTPVLDTYNTVNLNTPVQITGTEELWFGYRCNVTSGYPAGVDAGPATDGFGNMMYFQGEWSTLLALAPSLNYNWNIQGYVGFAPPAGAPAKLIPLAFNADRFNTGTLGTSGVKKVSMAVNSLDEGPDRILTGYKVWRLLSANQSNESLWTLLTPNTITPLQFVDNTWQPLPSGVYRFAVKAVYSNNVMAPASFSNEVHKGMMGTLAGTVTDFGTGAPIAGVTVTAGEYTGTTNAQGQYSFPVYQGVYTVMATKLGYQAYSQANVSITGLQTTTLNIQMVEIAYPPYNVVATEAANFTNVVVNWSAPDPNSAPTETFETGDFSSFPWVMGGVAPWTIDSSTAHSGANSARSGLITHSQATTMQVTRNVIVAGDISFWWSLDSETSFDFLSFYIDDVEMGSWSGTIGWTQASYPVSTGTHVFKWEYSKDSSVNVGQDCAWVDDIEFPSSTDASNLKFLALFPETANTLASADETDMDRSLVGYKVWRFLAANQGNEATWTSLTPNPITALTFTDNTWQPLPSGVYKYAVKAVYTNNVLSTPAFSNELHKGMMGTLMGTVTDFGSGTPIVGAVITAGTYSGTTNAQGEYSFGVYQGTYTVTGIKPGYQPFSQAGVVITGMQTTTVNIQMLEIAFPPYNVVATEAIDFSNAVVTWSAPDPNAAPVEDFETGDFSAFPWVMGGVAPWFVSTGTVHGGTYAAQSGDIEDSQNSTIELTRNVIIAGNISFWYSVSSESGWDYLRFYIDGVQMDSWSGTIGWTQATYPVSLGNHVFKWEYSKDGSISTGSDCAWIDDIEFPSSTPTAGYASLFSTASLNAVNDPKNANFTDSNSNTDSRILIGYKVWRLLAANQGNEATWTSLTPNPITALTFTDNAWAPLPSNVYKFAVKAVYTNNVLSAPAFSNEVHKGMMGVLAGTVTEFGTGVPIEGVTVRAGEYNGTTNAQGQYSFSVYQNTYEVTATKVGYQTATQSGVVITGLQTTTVNFVLTELTLPPVAVEATEINPSLVNVVWMEPGQGGGEWIHYDSGENDDSIGTGGVADFDVAIRYPASALQDYAGMSLYAVKVWPAQPGTFSVRVWTGGSPTAPGPMALDQPFTPQLDVYNTVVLNTPVAITGAEELWFGYRCNVTSGYPAGVDAGPATDGFGNMMYFQGAWSTLLELAPSLNYNWNIQGYVGYSAPTTASEITDPIARMIPTTQYGDRTLNGYRVWRLLQGQEANENAWTSLTPGPITATGWQDNGWGNVPDGNYRWAVKAIYTGGAQSLPAFSNMIPKLTEIGTVAGIVRNMQNIPVVGATVVSGTASATTNASGAYSMMLGSGTHSVTASHPNYASVTQNGVIVVTGQTTTVNFQLPASENLFTDGFESYTNFALTFPPWTTVDVDGYNTYTMTGTTWLNAGMPQAFIIFNPTATTPPATTITAHGGVKIAACVAATSFPNNDWLITPQITGSNRTIRFWAKSLTADYGLERFHVAVSTTGTDPADFTVISGATYVQAPVEWTEYTYSLSAYQGPIYVGIRCVSNDAWMFFVDDVTVVGIVPNDDPNVPVIVTELRNNFPNPFNPETTISYSLKEAGPVTVQIYNLKGQLVKTLVNEAKDAGQHTVIWNGKDNNGNAAASGVYFYKMNTGKYSSTKKMIMMK